MRRLPPLLLVVLSIACGRSELPSQQPGDEQTPGQDTGQNSLPPPVVAITSPARGDSVAGVVTVTGTASSDTADIVSVGVSLDGQPYVVADGAGRWTYHFDSAALADGVHTLRARAVDDAGTNGYSPLVGVSAANGTAPPPTDEANVGFPAYVDPELGRPRTREELEPHGASFASSSETVTGCIITSPIVLGSADVTLRGCLIELQSASASSTFALSSGTGTVRLEYTTIRTSDGSTYRSVLNNLNGGEPVIDHCDITNVATGFTDNRNGGIVKSSRIVATTTGIAFDDGGVGVQYANNIIAIGPGGQAAIAVAGSAVNMQITDNVLRGGVAHLRIAQSADVLRMRVLRNAMDGHTAPNYTPLAKPSSLNIVHTPEAQSADSSSILWPVEGTDVNRWAGTTDLTPSRENEVIDPDT